MNWEHFRTFVWLRWRLVRNQFARSGVVNLVLMLIFLVGALALSVLLFVGALLIGIFAFPEAPAAAIMYVWDGVVAAFLFFWLMGILIELQRSEMLSLDKFLHLPVSLSSAFLINYLASLINLTTIVFLPTMIGLSVGLVFAKGPAMLLVFPALAAFLLVVTALTHQFRGWLAAMMVNKRRRRTVIALVTMVIILVAQLPNLINIMRPWDAGPEGEAKQKQPAQDEAAQRQAEEETKRIVALVNMIAPPGWLPYAAMALADGNVLPALLATGVMGLVGWVSLRRSYRTTLRIYTGQYTSSPRPAQVQAPMPPAKMDKASAAFMENKLPWASEHASAIALACFRSLVRAPEAKMMLLSPVILALIFGSMLFTRSSNPPLFLRPLLATGGIAMIFMTTMQLTANQFGFDRNGFRTFVLCAAPRRDILLGKNLSFAPLVLGLSALIVLAIEIVFPLRLDHVLALLPQIISMFLLFCLLGNTMSILAPMGIAAGSFKPSKPSFTIVLLYLLLTIVLPLVLAPTLVPLAIAYLLDDYPWARAVPICLLAALAELAIIALLYRLALGWQGHLLQAREQKILETVTAKVE